MTEYILKVDCTAEEAKTIANDIPDGFPSADYMEGWVAGYCFGRGTIYSVAGFAQECNQALAYGSELSGYLFAMRLVLRDSDQ